MGGHYSRSGALLLLDEAILSAVESALVTAACRESSVLGLILNRIRLAASMD